MFGTVVAEMRETESTATIDEFVYRLTLWGSLSYLLLVFVFLFMCTRSTTAIADLKAAGSVITPLYSIIGILLGALFVSKRTTA